MTVHTPEVVFSGHHQVCQIVSYVDPKELCQKWLCQSLRRDKVPMLLSPWENGANDDVLWLTWRFMALDIWSQSQCVKITQKCLLHLIFTKVIFIFDLFWRQLIASTGWLASFSMLKMRHFWVIFNHCIVLTRKVSIPRIYPLLGIIAVLLYVE